MTREIILAGMMLIGIGMIIISVLMDRAEDRWENNDDEE